MIYTVTLNPALDKTVEIPSFTTDGVNRITSIRTDPGGKGINVSKVVAALGSTSRALGILGGSTGQMISEALSGLNMTCDFCPLRQHPHQSEGGGSHRPHQHRDQRTRCSRGPGYPAKPAGPPAEVAAPRRYRGAGRQLAGECSCRHLPRVGRCLPRKKVPRSFWTLTVPAWWRALRQAVPHQAEQTGTFRNVRS